MSALPGKRGLRWLLLAAASLSAIALFLLATHFIARGSPFVLDQLSGARRLFLIYLLADTAAAFLALAFLRVPMAFAMGIVGFVGFAYKVNLNAAAAMKAAFGENPKKVYGKKEKTPAEQSIPMETPARVASRKPSSLSLSSRLKWCTSTFGRLGISLPAR